MAFQRALTLATDLRSQQKSHIILGHPKTVTATTLPGRGSVLWGHYRQELSLNDIELAKKLLPRVEPLQVTDKFRRVGNALLFYGNGYNSDNADLALIAFTTCLESLFSTAEQELSFRLSLRVATFLAGKNTERRKLFEECKEVYRIGSKVVLLLRLLYFLSGKSQAKQEGGRTIYGITLGGKIIFALAMLLIGGLTVALLLQEADLGFTAILFGIFLLVTLGLPGKIVVDPSSGISMRRWYGRSTRIGWDQIAKVQAADELNRTVIVGTNGRKIVHTGFHVDSEGLCQQVSRLAGLPSAGNSSTNPKSAHG